MFELIIFIICFFAILIPCGFLLGKFISMHFNDDETQTKTKLQIFFDNLEKPVFRLCGIKPEKEMNASEYFFAIFYSNITLSVICFFILYFQNKLPYKGNVNFQLDIPLILHIISSLITNTCQTHHIPELHLTHLSNYFVMPLLMFYSSASGIATGVVFMRALTLSKIGNAYVDIVKSMTRVLFPICFLVTIMFTALGMPNTLTPGIEYNTLENIKQSIILGPVAAFEAIKLIGENGLSCFTANSAHPFENPNYLSNFFEIISITIIPVSLLTTLGFWLKNIKQAVIILCILFSVLSLEFTFTTFHELKGNPNLNNVLKSNFPNWVGKETRIGIVGSSVFEAAISNLSGASNSSLESFNPIVNLFGLFNLANQSVFGVQGFGTVFTINFILYTSFFIGLMLGKTPEIFGKKIEKEQVILSSLLLLINPILVLVGVAVTLMIHPVNAAGYEQVHYYTRVFYEFSSGAASNGSGLEGLQDNTPYWNLSLATVMFAARYLAMAAMIFLGGSLAHKPKASVTDTTFKSDTVLFGIVFTFMSTIATILVYFPFFILGPITEISTGR